MTKRKAFFLVFIVGILLTFTYLLSNFYKSRPSTVREISDPLKTEAKIKIGQNEINIEIAETPQEKAKGLSGKPKLDDNQGMLFIFSPKSRPAFWMKDMLIPLDMIWISDSKIVHINENVPPPSLGQKDNELSLYSPPVSIDFILEVNAGFSQKYSIKVGDSVDLSGIK